MTALAAGFWCAVAFAPAAYALGADGAAPPPIVDQAIRTYAADTRGIIGARTTGTATFAGQPAAVFRVTGGTLWVDGAVVALKIYASTFDGRDTSGGLPDLQRMLDQRLAPELERSPLRTQGEPYHRYEIVPCADCPSGVVAASFTSLVRDAQHRDGTLWIERSTGHILKMVSRVAVPRADVLLETTTTYGPILTDAWGAVREQLHTEVQTQSGLVASDMTITLDRCRRFASAEEGPKAVENGSL
jgi:hypothetical protein